MRVTVLFFCLFVPLLHAQVGIAPKGYYPASYRGDTFTGTVIASGPDSDSITLEFRKDDKSEQFVVRLENGCDVPSRTGERMHAKNIPNGTVLTAFHMGKTEKQNGSKHRVNVAIGIRFLVWQGKPVSEENRHKLYRCGPDGGWSYFRAFSGTQEGGAAVFSPADIIVPRH